VAIYAAVASGRFVRVAVIWRKNMLHDARMAGLAKLRRSIRSTDERQLRPVHNDFLPSTKSQFVAMRKAASSPKLLARRASANVGYLVAAKDAGQKRDLPMDRLIELSALVPKQAKVPAVYFDELFLTCNPVEHGTLYFGITMNHFVVAPDHHLNGHCQRR
jgi:hypothetical protein